MCIYTYICVCVCVCVCNRTLITLLPSQKLNHPKQNDITMNTGYQIPSLHCIINITYYSGPNAGKRAQQNLS